MYLEHRQSEDGEVLSTVVELEPCRTDGLHWPNAGEVVVEAMDKTVGTEAGARINHDRTNTKGFRVFYYGKVTHHQATALQERFTKWLDDLQRFIALQAMAAEIESRETKRKAKP